MRLDIWSFEFRIEVEIAVDSKELLRVQILLDFDLARLEGRFSRRLDAVHIQAFHVYAFFKNKTG